MKGLSSILKLSLIFCILREWQGRDAGCVVPEVPHSSRNTTNARVNSQDRVTYMCLTPPYIHIYGSLTITCTDREGVFDREPPVCGPRAKSKDLFFMTPVEFKCIKGFQFPNGNTSVTWTCDEIGGFGVDSLSCTGTLLEAGAKAGSADSNLGVSVGFGVTGAIVLVLLVVIVVVFIKCRRKQCYASQPSKAVDADHSDTSELYQNSLSPPDSADRKHEYMSLEAKTMSTASRMAEYVNVNDSDYTVLRTAANETNDRHPTPANVDHWDSSELYQNNLSPPDSADRDHEYTCMSLEAKTMTTVNNVAEYVNVNDSAYTALCMSANKTNQRHPPAPGIGIYQNEV